MPSLMPFKLLDELFEFMLLLFSYLHFNRYVGLVTSKKKNKSFINFIFLLIFHIYADMPVHL